MGAQSGSQACPCSHPLLPPLSPAPLLSPFLLLGNQAGPRRRRVVSCLCLSAGRRDPLPGTSHPQAPTLSPILVPMIRFPRLRPRAGRETAGASGSSQGQGRRPGPCGLWKEVSVRFWLLPWASSENKRHECSSGFTHLQNLPGAARPACSPRPPLTQALWGSLRGLLSVGSAPSSALPSTPPSLLLNAKPGPGWVPREPPARGRLAPIGDLAGPQSSPCPPWWPGAEHSEGAQERVTPATLGRPRGSCQGRFAEGPRV